MASLQYHESLLIKLTLGAGVMVQYLKALPVLVEDQVWFPAPHLMAQKPPKTLAPQALTPSVLCGQPTCMQCTDINAVLTYLK